MSAKDRTCIENYTGDIQHSGGQQNFGEAKFQISFFMKYCKNFAIMKFRKNSGIFVKSKQCFLCRRHARIAQQTAGATTKPERNIAESSDYLRMSQFLVYLTIFMCKFIYIFILVHVNVHLYVLVNVSVLVCVSVCVYIPVYVYVQYSK